MISLFLAAAVAAATPPPVAPSKACDNRPECRWVGSFELLDAKGEAQTVIVNSDLDFIDDGRLNLTPGEMVLVKLKEEGGGKVSFVVTAKGRIQAMSKASADTLVSGIDEEALNGAKPMTSIPDDVAVGDPPPDTIRFSFQQMPGKQDMSLIVENGYDRPVDYTAGMLLMTRPHTGTTVCELLPKLVSFEHWPHPIVMLDVGGFRFLPAGTRQIVCD